MFEDAVKAEVTKKVEAMSARMRSFATNTSTLPITELAKASAPEQFIGIHFFSPVDKMLLVEIIKGQETGDARGGQGARLSCARSARRRSWSMTRASSMPTAASSPIINEGIRMVHEGVHPADRERSQMLGLPLGPLQLVDETSIDLGVKIAKATKAAMGDAYDDRRSDDCCSGWQMRTVWAASQRGLLCL